MRRTSTIECRQAFVRKCTGEETETAASRRELRETTCQKCSQRHQVRRLLQSYQNSWLRGFNACMTLTIIDNDFWVNFRPKSISRNCRCHKVFLCQRTGWTQSANMYWWRIAVYGRWQQTRTEHSWTMLGIHWYWIEHNYKTKTLS